MSTVVKPTSSHPNKLIAKYEIFLANKMLVTRLRTTKSSIPQLNRDFEKKLQNRKKKSNSKSQSSEVFIDQKALQDILEQRIDLLTNPNYQFTNPNSQFTGEERLPLQPKSSNRKQRCSENPQTSHEYNTYSTTQYKLSRTASTREISSQRRRESCKTQRKSFINHSENAELCSKPFPQNNEIISQLKDKLNTKTQEVQSLKNELKDWWHEDSKSKKLAKSNSNAKTIEQQQPILQAFDENIKLEDLFSGNSQSRTTGERQDNSQYLMKAKRLPYLPVRLTQPKNHYTAKNQSDRLKTAGEIVFGDENLDHSNTENCKRPFTVRFALENIPENLKIQSSAYFHKMFPNKSKARYQDLTSSTKEEEILEKNDTVEELSNKEISKLNIDNIVQNINCL